MFAENNEEKTTKIKSEEIPTIMERPSGATPRPSTPAPSPADAKTMRPPSPPPASVPAPAPSGASWVNRTFGSLLSGLGITNPQTQQYTVYGAGGLIVLCCGCSCLALVLYFASTMGR